MCLFCADQNLRGDHDRTVLAFPRVHPRRLGPAGARALRSWTQPLASYNDALLLFIEPLVHQI